MLFFFFGMGVALPGPLFSRAQDYWEYKFRDPSSDHADQRNRTELQIRFITWKYYFDIGPCLIALAATSMFGHKVGTRVKIIPSLAIICAMNLGYCIFCNINTDSWQREFLYVTLAMSTITSAAVIVFTVSNIVPMSKFPNRYVKYYMYGNAVGGILAALLQCIALSIGGSSIVTGLIYFSVGTVIMLYTLFLAIISNRLPLYQYYMDDTMVVEKPVHSFKEMFGVGKKIWVNLISIVVNLFFIMPGVPYSVISENHGTVFAVKYFRPVCTHILSDAASLVGRIFSGPYITKRNRYLALLTNIATVGSFGILLLFCRTSPKRNSPLLFPHDWEYMCILGLHQVFFHFFIVSMILSVRNLVKPNQVEMGFLIMTSISEVLAMFMGFLAKLWMSIV
ncbi:unnamed protein product [Callosobruchus maculatus]|nr:unnamed protein product [Callosobruchus maculatus]